MVIVMKAKQAVSALSAIAHDSRLAIYRMLVEEGPQGLAAGDIAARLAMPPSSLTFHLQQMLHAGLVTQRRLGRQLIYAADYTSMNDLIAYLTENCCGGTSQCAPTCNPASVSAAKARKLRRSA
jgi:DNA-binding transcriptional ArsR family regulator